MFIHGGGDNAHRADREIVRALRGVLGTDVTVDYPYIPGLEEIEWAAISGQLSEQFANLTEGSIVVAHSLGGAAALKVLSSNGRRCIASLFLLAPPYKAEDGEWPNDDFTLPNDFAEHLPSDLTITICHSGDDEIIPVSDARRYGEKLPAATICVLSGYGHQFNGSLEFLARDIRAALQAGR